MFKKFNILIILLLLFISITAVGAVDDNVDLASDEINIDNLELSDDMDEISSDAQEEVLSEDSVTISNSEYNNYFDSDGTYKGSSSSMILSGSFSSKNFTFNKPVSVSGDASNNLKNVVFTFLNGASGSTVSNLKITNEIDATYGIFLNSASNCVIKDCVIINHGKSSYPICLGNGANYNNVTGNKLTTSGADYGHGTRSTPTLLVSGSHHNNLVNNTMDVEDANAIYLSSYNGGPLSGGDSNYNLIFNNTINYHVLPTSWSYAIQIMGSHNTIKSNKVTGAYRGICTSGVYNTITENWIIDLTGADYNNNNIEVGGEFAIVGAAYSTVTNNNIINARIISTGSGISVIDNSVVENNYIEVKYSGKGISASGYNVIIRNNNILTDSGVGIHENDDGSGLIITKNNITSNSGICILIEKLSSKRMPSNVTITYNNVRTSNEYAIDASGVEEGTGTFEGNNVHGKKIKDPSGVYDASKPSYKYNESKTYTVTPENIRSYITANGNLVGDVEDGVILKFEGTFSKEVIYITKAIKIIGNGATFLNSTFKVTSGGVWIENLHIINKNAERLNAWGIYVNEASGVKIVNNNIEVNDPNAAYAIYVLQSSYVEVINNTLFSDGNFLTYTLLSYSSEDCIFANNTINTLGTGEKYGYSPESSIEGTVFNVNGTDVCVDGSTVCIDGVTYCLDGSTVCIDGSTYCLDGNVLVVNGERYPIEQNNTVCIDGVTYPIDGNKLTINGTVYCLDGSVVCLDGDVLIYNGKNYTIVDNNVTIDGETVCIDGSTVCIDGVTYCLDGNVLCIDGVTYCLDGNELVVNGSSYGKTNHMVPEIYRTYGILLLYSSFNEISGNNVTVKSKLNETYPTTGRNASENSIVGIDIYYNSHNNTVSNNYVSVTSNDNYIYGVGVLGYQTGHAAPQGQGASNNKFIGNTIILSGPYFTQSIVIGQSSEGTIIYGNIANISSNVTYGINLEGSHSSTIKNNEFTQNSVVAYGIEGFNSNNNIIEGNKIEANGVHVYGVIMSGNNNNIINNDINANGAGDEISFNAHDALGSGNAGIYLSGNASNNLVKSNNITSQKGFAVILASSGNTIEDNYLKSEKGNSTRAINGTEGNIIKDNYVYRVVGAIEDSQIPYLCSGNIILKVQNPEGISLDGAIVSFYEDYGKNIGNVSVSDGIAILTYQIDESYESVDAQYMVKAILKKEDFKVTTFESEGLTVTKGNLNVSVNDAYVKEGLKGKFTATVTNGLGKPVSGLTVRFFNFDTGNRQAIGTATTDSNGVAIISTPIDLNFEEYFGTVTNITAIVSESDYYVSSNSSGKLTIIDIVPITINMVSKLSYNSVLATLTDNNGFGVANKDVSVTIDGKVYNTKTNANGEVILPSVNAGSHNIVVSSAKDSNFESASASNKVTVVASISGNANANVFYGNTVQYKIRIADKNGNYLGANNVITIKVNGKAQKLKTDKNGYVVYTVKKVGTYTITAEYNGQKVSNKIVIKPTLTAKNISKKKAKKIKFSAKLVDKKGKVLKNKKVAFKVKGKKYTAKTNKKGVATVTLKNLKVGKYTITSSFGGCTISNKITIKK